MSEEDIKHCDWFECVDVIMGVLLAAGCAFDWMHGFELEYGSDCSGADGPAHALKWLNVFTGIVLHIVWKFSHVFASEDPGKNGDGPRRFLRNNYDIEYMFSDACDREASGTCSNTDTRVPLPKTEVYTAGSICKDASKENTMNPHIVDIQNETGMTSKTLKASMDYVALWYPAYVMLENVYRKVLISEIQKAFDALKVYVLIIFGINSKTFKLRQSRPRLFAIAINIMKVKISENRTVGNIKNTPISFNKYFIN